jgi:hypothetical protein
MKKRNSKTRESGRMTAAQDLSGADTDQDTAHKAQKAAYAERDKALAGTRRGLCIKKQI